MKLNSNAVMVIGPHSGDASSAPRQVHLFTAVTNTVARRSHRRFTLLLPRTTFNSAFACILVLRILCAVFLLGLATCYWYLSQPYVRYYANLLAYSNSLHLRMVGFVFGYIGVLHLVMAAIALYKVQRRTSPMVRNSMMFTMTRRGTQAPSRIASRVAAVKLAARQRRKRALIAPFIAAMQSFWHKVFNRHGLLGVEGVHFNTIFVVREVVEIISQTFQAHRCSNVLARAWINHLYIALVVANCWSTPLIHLMLRNSPPTERVVCLAVDMLLNMATSMVIPSIVFVPYMSTFDFQRYEFPQEHLYNDVWFTNMVLENQLVFAISTADFISKLIPHISIYACIESIQLLLRRKSSTVVAIARQLKSMPAEKPPTVLFVRTGAQPAVKTKRTLDVKKFANIAVHTGFFIWGLVVLTLHCCAVQKDVSMLLPGCKQVQQPWLPSQYPCALMNFNCHQNGSKTPSPDALAFLDEDSLVGLVFSHCPALIMPADLNRFTNLITIEVYNCTIVDWSSNASIANNSRLSSLVLALVNLTELPIGIAQPLPAVLTNIEISTTNLTTLPDDLHTKWPHLSILYLEHSLFKTMPTALLHMHIDELSLIGNDLVTLSTFFSRTNRSMYVMALDDNPLQELPASVDSDTQLGFLSIERTAVATLPSWVAHQIDQAIYAVDTPLCASHDAAAAGFPKLTCQPLDQRSHGRYPVQYMTTIRSLVG